MGKSMLTMNGTLTDIGATELAQRIKSGEISAHETVEAYIHRIEKVNPSLNALVIPSFEEALAQAAAADEARSRKER